MQKVQAHVWLGKSKLHLSLPVQSLSSKQVSLGV